MSDARVIEADPAWLPHRLDPVGRRVLFLRIERDQLSAPGFLADRKPSGPRSEIWLGYDEVLAMRPEMGPLHFIFHTAFCRSTLLIRALDMPGVSIGLSEPGILASLASAGEAGRPLIKPILDLLARPHAPGEVVFVKPTNHSNMLIPALLAARPEAKAVLMTAALPAFLASVGRKGLMGRRWARSLYLELQSYAAADFGMDAREQFAMTDMQAAGLAWFLNQRWFAMHLSSRNAPRLRILDGDRFNEDREHTFLALAEFANFDLSRDRAKAAAESPVFARHAKLDEEFATNEARDKERTLSPIADEEIGQVGQWIDLIAGQAKLQLPLRQSLF